DQLAAVKCLHAIAKVVQWSIILGMTDKLPVPFLVGITGRNPMPTKRYIVALTPEERQHLTGLVSSGRRSARTITRACILHQADQGQAGPAFNAAAQSNDRKDASVELAMKKTAR